MKYDYAYEKLFLTVDILATGKDRIKERLLDAVISQFECLSPGKETNFLPPELQKKYDEIMNSLTKVEAIADEGTLNATISKLNEDEAQHYAKEIVSMLFQLIMNYYEK